MLKEASVQLHLYGSAGQRLSQLQPPRLMLPRKTDDPSWAPVLLDLLCSAPPDSYTVIAVKISAMRPGLGLRLTGAALHSPPVGPMLHDLELEFLLALHHREVLWSNHTRSCSFKVQRTPNFSVAILSAAPFRSASCFAPLVASDIVYVCRSHETMPVKVTCGI